MNALAKLFNSHAQVKIMRLFLFHPETIFDAATIARKAKVTSAVARSEINRLKRIGMIKERTISRPLKTVKKGGAAPARKLKSWVLDRRFLYIKSLQQMLTATDTINESDMLQRLRPIGRLKLVLVAGVFTQDSDSRVDLFIVGDQIKQSVLERIIQDLEAELGTELAYAAFETPDFHYRLTVYDKLVRDVLDYPHQKLYDRLGL